MKEPINSTCIDSLCASLSYAMGLEAPANAAPANPELNAFVDNAFGGEKCDRIFMYNPDAIGQWVYRKYPQLFKELAFREYTEFPFHTVMPSVTPVCFGTMYTGAQPDVHGIKQYEKPVISIDTIFDVLIRAGKKAVIIGDAQSSLCNIYLNRDMDYYPCEKVEDVNAKAAEIILKDEHDFVVVYNKNYDSIMHKYGPESLEALTELRCNVETLAMFDSMIAEHWKHHRTLLGFAMDHGAHEIDGGCGSHGLDMPEDLNIVHLYKTRG